jgi:hypothetical protein
MDLGLKSELTLIVTRPLSILMMQELMSASVVMV